MAISHDDYKQSLLRFSERVPELLSRHGSTAAAAIEVARLDLARQLARPQFTVAVIGRMKAGKSTLLNALVGTALAPVGVNETTATLNWFYHGTGDKTGSFEIHWNDPARGVEHRPLASIGELLGRSEEAKSISHVRFFCDSPFLQGVRLIDTPGLMSTLDSHEAATADLITRRSGERADATILVFPTVATQADLKALQDFAEQTRLPGQAPHNTVAVIQRWEMLNAPDPMKAALDLAANFQRRLDGHVSEVLPVSGLLATMSRQVSAESFDKLAFLATRTAPADLSSIIRSDGRFALERTGVALSGAERDALFADIRGSLLGASASGAAGTYEMVRFTLGLAQRAQIATGEKLKQAVWSASNLDRLQDVLHRRFFAISGLIQAGSVLKKALDPCRVSLFNLRYELDRRRELVVQGEAVRSLLTRSAAPTEAERGMLAYLNASLPLLDEQVKPVETTLRELDELVHFAEEDFKLLVTDIACLDMLRDRPGALSAEHVSQARRLFGQYGMERHVRLGVEAGSTLPEQYAIATRLHQTFAGLGWGNRVARHAIDRLDRILNEIELQT